jgi:hypothetical protein
MNLNRELRGEEAASKVCWILGDGMRDWEKWSYVEKNKKKEGKKQKDISS